MKILIFDNDCFINGPNCDILDNELTKLGHDVIRHNPASNYYKGEYSASLTRHFQMYEFPLRRALEEKVDILFFNGMIAVPEYLLSELEAQDFPFKVVFLFGSRESAKSEARAKTLKKLIKNKHVKKGILFSMIGKHTIFPDNVIQNLLDLKKLKILQDPISGQSKEDYLVSREKSRDFFNIPQDAFVVASLGRLSYHKGAKILYDSLKFIDKEVFLIIQTNGKYTDSDINFEEGLKIYHHNSKFIDKYLSIKEYAMLVRASNALVLPHRKSYIFGSSGVPVNAALGEIPIIAPDFTPFRDIVMKYYMGLAYKPENPRDLALAIKDLRTSYKVIIEGCKFEEYLANAGTFKNIAKIITK